MAQLIDKDAVLAIIEKDLSYYKDLEDREIISDCGIACYRVVKMLKSNIDSLEVKEVDLEKYYHDFLQKEWFGNSHARTVSEMMAFTAKHFFELGLNAQCEISYVPNIDDSLEELNVDPTSKEAKIFKESYYIALETLKAQKGEEV